MSHIAYYRCSTGDQSVDAQRVALGGDFEREFEDVGVSGSVMAADRPAFGQLLDYVREGDTVHIYAIDRLGRDALDVQATVRHLIGKGVMLDVRGLGVIGRGVGELIVAVLAQVADMERQRIRERCDSGREAAKASLAATGLTHRGKVSMGRPTGRRAGQADVTPAEVVAWRKANGASIAETAAHFQVGKATVTRYWSAAKTAG